MALPSPRDDWTRASSLYQFLDGVLDSDEKTQRLRAIILDASIAVVRVAMGLGLAAVPVASVIYLMALKAPLELKAVMGGASTLVIGAGSFLLQRRRSARRASKAAAKIKSQDSPELNQGDG